MFVHVYIVLRGFVVVAVVSVVLLLLNVVLQTSMKARQRDCRKPLHIITSSMCKKCSVMFAIVEINTKINKKAQRESIKANSTTNAIFSPDIKPMRKN